MNGSWRFVISAHEKLNLFNNLIYSEFTVSFITQSIIINGKSFKYKIVRRNVECNVYRSR